MQGRPVPSLLSLLAESWPICGWSAQGGGCHSGGGLGRKRLTGMEQGSKEGVKRCMHSTRTRKVHGWWGFIWHLLQAYQWLQRVRRGLGFLPEWSMVHRCSGGSSSSGSTGLPSMHSTRTISLPREPQKWDEVGNMNLNVWLWRGIRQRSDAFVTLTLQDGSKEMLQSSCFRSQSQSQ